MTHLDPEHIIKIEETRFTHPESDTDPDDPWSDWGGYEGYVITTNRQRIYLGISTGEQCCEVTGYFMSEDNCREFIGARLVSVSVSDTNLSTKELPVPYLDHGGVCFVTLATDMGDLQFVCYNSHNGYYGHEALVWCEQVRESMNV